MVDAFWNFFSWISLKVILTLTLNICAIYYIKRCLLFGLTLCWDLIFSTTGLVGDIVKHRFAPALDEQSSLIVRLALNLRTRRSRVEQLGLTPKQCELAVAREQRINVIDPRKKVHLNIIEIRSRHRREVCCHKPVLNSEQ